MCYFFLLGMQLNLLQSKPSLKLTEARTLDNRLIGHSTLEGS